MISKFPHNSCFPLKPADILIPKAEYLSSNWPVVACDQFSSEPEFWEKNYKTIADNPSSLHCILPEYMLEENDTNYIDAKIKKIWSTMNVYTDSVLHELEPSIILCQRSGKTSKSPRKGVIVALDLEAYSYDKNEKSYIRATEATVESRLPARARIRAGASLELPHILLLIDDAGQDLMSTLVPYCDSSNLIYDIELNDEAGHIKGNVFSAQEQITKDFFTKLAELDSYKNEQLLAYVGDGNHSLASAKLHWNNLKNDPNISPEELLTHPARYALVELLSIHDPGLDFHPIHQLVYNCTIQNVIKRAEDLFSDENLWLSEPIQLSGENKLDDYKTLEKLFTEICQENINGSRHCFLFRQGTSMYKVVLKSPKTALAIETAHSLTASFMNDNKRVDYIHGEKALYKLSSTNNCAIYLAGLNNQEFFPILDKFNQLPKKTFSIGNALDKRFYMEARKIQ